MNTEQIINRINDLCDSSNISINQMLKECGLHKSIVDNLKKGSMPSPDKLSKIADHFGVTIDYLLGRNPHKMVADRIKVLLEKEHKYDYTPFADGIGVSNPIIADWITGTSNSFYDYIDKIADYFNVSTDYLLGKPPIPPTNGRQIPVLGQVAAGLPITAVQDILDYEEITPEMAAQGEHFALKVKGNSMEPKFSEGDVVIVRQQSDIESGDIAVIMTNGQDATIKKIIKHDIGITLSPTNPVYEPLTYSNEQIEKMPITIIGKVVELRAKF